MPDENLPGAFLNDPLVKFQFQATRTRLVLDGERSLMFAVLMDALDTYAKTREAKTYRRRLEHREVRGWIVSKSTDGPFTFLNICDTLRLDPDAVRMLIKSPRFAEPYSARRWRHIAADRELGFGHDAV